MRGYTLTMNRASTGRRLKSKLALKVKASRDAFVRESFLLPRVAARAKARAVFDAFPKAAYMTAIESWRELPGDQIEFTMRRLPSAD